MFDGFIQTRTDFFDNRFVHNAIKTIEAEVSYTKIKNFNS